MPFLRAFDDGVELVVHAPAREAVVDLVVARRDELRAAALALMALYLRPDFRPEVFWLDTVEVAAERSPDGEDAVLSFSYAPDDDPQAEAYTRFDVAVRLDDEVRAVRFTVGLH